MAKGLHKNSLRKVDNPHQWMIDDARMELIQQIKAEVERLKDENNNIRCDSNKAYCQGYGDAFVDLFPFLSTLEKSNSKDFPTTDEEMKQFLATHPKVELPEKYKTPDWIFEKSEKPINPTTEKLRALIKMQIRREELNFASLGSGGQTMNIGALEWVLKQLDTLQEQPVKGPFTGEQIYKFLKEQQPNFLEEQPVELEKEIASFITQFGWGNTKHLAEKELINRTARHFANIGWNNGYIKGREDAHKPARDVGLPKRFDKQPVCGLEEEMIAWHKKHFKGKRKWEETSGEYLEHSSQLDIARHFYELGRNAK